MSARSIRRSLLALAVAAAMVGAVPIAHAQSHGQGHEEAERLFREGRALFDAGSIAEACERFEQSQRVEPAAGTALNLGNCFERIGLVASAYAAYKEAAVDAGLRRRRDWEEFALRRMEALGPKVPRILVRIPTASRIEGLVVTRDEKPLAIDGATTEHRLDPGTHTVAARAPGHATWSTTIHVSLGESHAVEIPALARASTATESAGPMVTREAPPGGTWQRPVGFLVGGVGAAAAAFGGIAGLIALDGREQAASKCPSYPSVCTAEGTELNDRAMGWATASTISLIAGGVLVLAGGVLLLAAPSSSDDTRTRSARRGLTWSF